MSSRHRRYLARGPLTVGGRDWRSGDRFLAYPDAMAEHLASGAAVPSAPPAADGPGLDGATVATDARAPARAEPRAR